MRIPRWLPALLVVAACTPAARPPAASPSASPSVTARPSPSPSVFRFAVIGDWGAGTREQRAIAQRMCATRQTAPFDVVVTTGDNFYGPDGTATGRNYRDPSKCLIDGGIRWRATWGNHDVVGTSTATVLGAKERWYTWRADGVEFFMLDSNQPSNARQRNWLDEALGDSDAPVKIVAFHHPPYTGGYHESNQAVRQAWVPLFRKHDVTLVLSGHNHAYEHSIVDGVDYVISGGGGASVYPCVSRPVTMLICRPRHHFLLVEASADGVTVAALLPDGSQLDRFTID